MIQSQLVVFVVSCKVHVTVLKTINLQRTKQNNINNEPLLCFDVIRL